MSKPTEGNNEPSPVWRQAAWRAGRLCGLSSRRAVLTIMAAALALPSARRLGAARKDAVSTKSLRWVAFYGQTADEAALASYDIVVLDPGFQGSIQAATGSGAQALGYLSLGEIRTADPWFQRIDPEALREENSSWPGTRRVDVRHPSWRSLVLDHLVPAILGRGFTGLMFDTLDTPAYLEQVDRRRNAGMRQASIDLVRAIRSRHPRIKLAMNRGYAALPKLADVLDLLIAESLLTRPNTADGGAAWVSAQEVAQQLALLAPAKRRSPPLPVLSLDYWAPEDDAVVELIYRRERALGHHPYVAPPLMDRIVPEPQKS